MIGQTTLPILCAGGLACAQPAGDSATHDDLVNQRHGGGLTESAKAILSSATPC
jgi:hypothetical protein